MASPQNSATLALGAYAESFLHGRRVVVFGSSSSELGELLLDRGARLVHMYDTDAARVASRAALGGPAGISYAVLPSLGLPVRDGAFDVGFIENLATFEDPADVINRLRRALSARGVGFIATPNPDCAATFDAPATLLRELNYYEMYDLACAEFDEIRTLGQTPFAGYALSDFSPDREETFSIDTAQVPGGAEEPEWFIALVSHFPVQCDPFSVIQLPVASLLSNSQSEAALAQSQSHATTLQRAAQLETELQTTKQRAETGERNHDLLVGARAELERRDRWVKELEQRLNDAEAQVTTLTSRQEKLEAQNAKLQDQSAKLQAHNSKLESANQEARQRVAGPSDSETQLRREHEELTRKHQGVLTRGSELEQELKTLKQRLAETDQARLVATELAATKGALSEGLQQQLSTARSEVQAAQAAVEQNEQQAQAEREAESAQFELQLQERAQTVKQLKRDLSATETFAAQVLMELETTKAALSSSAEQAAEPDSGGAELASLNAEQAADLVANRWRIAELEQRLRDSKPSQLLEEQLQKARSELQRHLALLTQVRETSH